jgi:hypothetical protein
MRPPVEFRSGQARGQQGSVVFPPRARGMQVVQIGQGCVKVKDAPQFRDGLRMLVHPQVEVRIFLVSDHPQRGRYLAAPVSASRLAGLECDEEPFTERTSRRLKRFSHRQDRFVADQEVPGHEVPASLAMSSPGLNLASCECCNGAAGVHDAELSPILLVTLLMQSGCTAAPSLPQLRRLWRIWNRGRRPLAAPAASPACWEL